MPQICSHMPGLKDVHKDLAEMIRKISFIALLLPFKGRFSSPDVGLPQGGLAGFEFDHVQTYRARLKGGG